VQMRGDLRTELLSVQQQLVAVQELTGQSSNAHRAALAHRIARAATRPGDAGHGALRSVVRESRGPGPIRCTTSRYSNTAVAVSRRRGSGSANSCGFFQLMSGRPMPSSTSAKASSRRHRFRGGVYDQLVRAYPKSPRAPSALYKLGLLAEQRGDKATARTFYSG